MADTPLTLAETASVPFERLNPYARSKWLGELLGAVRDADVLLERLHRHASELSPRDSRATAALFRRLTVQRDEARLALLTALRGERYEALLDRLIAATEVVPVTADADKPPRDALPEPSDFRRARERTLGSERGPGRRR